jgi:Rieske Fe-S protein
VVNRSAPGDVSNLSGLAEPAGPTEAPVSDARLPHRLAHAVLSRRRALAAGGGTLGVGSLLAACGDDAADTGATPETTTSSSSSATTTGAEQLTTVSAVPVGSALLVTNSSGAPVVVAQPTDGTIIAFSGLCTHQGCAVTVAAEELGCPCHGSRFDTLTGAVLQGPATDPLTPYEVTVDGDSVVATT